MATIRSRDLLPYPQGDNNTDALIETSHFNLTTLRHWNYTYYSNGTISNGSRCYLIFKPHTPVLLQNGTFLHGDSCYSPIKPIGLRAILGLVFACIFALSIMFTLINLRKHGKRFLPAEKRFRAVGRRWQWYWMLAVGTCALISGITNVDVDRYYLPELPLVLSNFFWFMMLPTTMALIWESIRHWGSWLERQAMDANPYMFRQEDRRSRVELLLPLGFYFCFWMNIFMIVPRSWTNIEKQRDSIQTLTYAEPTATDIRFKLGALFLFFGWLTTTYSLLHSIKHYKVSSRNFIYRLLKSIPTKFLLTLPLALILIGYEGAIAFDFSISPLKLGTRLGFMYGLGWAPITLIMLVYEVAGYKDPNEDRALIQQRRIRGAEIDAEIGAARKPHWWTQSDRSQAQGMSSQARIDRSIAKIGGGSATTKNIHDSIEMRAIPTQDKNHGLAENRPWSRNTEAVRTAASLLFPPVGEKASTKGEKMGTGNDMPQATSISSDLSAERQMSRNSSTSIANSPQKIRSMLDI